MSGSKVVARQRGLAGLVTGRRSPGWRRPATTPETETDESLWVPIMGYVTETPADQKSLVKTVCRRLQAIYRCGPAGYLNSWKRTEIELDSIPVTGPGVTRMGDASDG